MEYCFRAFIILFIIYNLAIISLFFWFILAMRDIKYLLSDIRLNTTDMTYWEGD